ncbi:MAG: c-type cytochrome, partial [Proteobacteria bacterium]|nr:c-type cytochrome [Pseudomonadota bacterium]
AGGARGPIQAQGHQPIATYNQEEVGPLWAYARSAPAKAGETYVPQNPELGAEGMRPGDDEAEVTKRWTVTGSDKQFTRLDFRSHTSYPEWFPGDYPQPPPSVNMVGSPSLGNTARACALCHLANGKGRPENAPPGGQPAAYTIQQLQDMRNDLRNTSDPKKSNPHTMVRLAKGMTEQEMKDIAEFYEAIPWTPWIRVIETDMVPEMELEEGNMFITEGVDRVVPLGGIIVETPENELESNYLRSPRSGWNAYVPVGSLAKGRELVTTGGGKTVACNVCHGADLMGIGIMPGIAGRSPSYMMRQMWDMKQGTRKGPNAALMMPIINSLTVEDMTNIVAYLASVMPLPGPVAPPTHAP